MDNNKEVGILLRVVIYITLLSILSLNKLTKQCFLPDIS